MQILTRGIRRFVSRGITELRAPEFGSPKAANLFFGRTIERDGAAETVPAIGWRLSGADGREYQIMLTDADIKAITEARTVSFAGEEYEWPK